MSGEIKVFIPIKRRLFDLILILNFGLFLSSAFRLISSAVLWPLSLILNAGLILGWFFVLSPLLTIRLENSILSGRGPRFKKTSIPLRKIHYSKTNTRTYGISRRLFKDIWSTEGKKIRLHRKFLGESQVEAIMSAIEAYPFREGAPSESKTDQS